MAIPDLTESYVAANYRRATVPFTRFGTRELAFYNIYIYNMELKAITYNYTQDGIPHNKVVGIFLIGVFEQFNFCKFIKLSGNI